MFIIIVFDFVLTRSTPVYKQDLYCSPPGPKGSVAGCDSSLWSFCYSHVYFLSLMHLHSGYYCYDFVIIGVPRPLWSNRNSLLEDKQKKMIIWLKNVNTILVKNIFTEVTVESSKYRPGGKTITVLICCESCFFSQMFAISQNFGGHSCLWRRSTMI